VAEYHHKRGTQHGHRVLDAAENLRTDRVPSRAYHEQVTQTAVEDELNREPRVGTTEDHREGLLPVRQRDAAVDILVGADRSSSGEPPVTRVQLGDRRLGADRLLSLIARSSGQQLVCTRMRFGCFGAIHALTSSLWEAPT